MAWEDLHVDILEEFVERCTNADEQFELMALTEAKRKKKNQDAAEKEALRCKLQPAWAAQRKSAKKESARRSYTPRQKYVLMAVKDDKGRTWLHRRLRGPKKAA